MEEEGEQDEKKRSRSRSRQQHQRRRTNSRTPESDNVEYGGQGGGDGDGNGGEAPPIVAALGGMNLADQPTELKEAAPIPVPLHDDDDVTLASTLQRWGPPDPVTDDLPSFSMVAPNPKDLDNDYARNFRRIKELWGTEDDNVVCRLMKELYDERHDPRHENPELSVWAFRRYMESECQHSPTIEFMRMIRDNRAILQRIKLTGLCEKDPVTGKKRINKHGLKQFSAQMKLQIKLLETVAKRPSASSVSAFQI
jgi:hypothetical protein